MLRPYSRVRGTWRLAQRWRRQEADVAWSSATLARLPMSHDWGELSASHLARHLVRKELGVAWLSAIAAKQPLAQRCNSPILVV